MITKHILNYFSLLVYIVDNNKLLIGINKFEIQEI